jgi:hypothetical protein
MEQNEKRIYPWGIIHLFRQSFYLNNTQTGGGVGSTMHPCCLLDFRMDHEHSVLSTVLSKVCSIYFVYSLPFFFS